MATVTPAVKTCPKTDDYIQHISCSQMTSNQSCMMINTKINFENRPARFESWLQLEIILISLSITLSNENSTLLLEVVANHNIITGKVRHSLIF